MNTRSGKKKGRSLQNQVAKDLAQRTGLRYGSPNDDLADLRGRLMGTPGADIVRSELAMKVVPFYAECKNTESWSFSPAVFGGGLRQLVQWYCKTCEASAKLSDELQNHPVVIVAKSYHPPIIVFNCAMNRWIEERMIERKEDIFAPTAISMEVPIARFLEDRQKRSFIDVVVNILSLSDFLDMWFGKLHT